MHPDDEIDFMNRVYYKSGLGPEHTYLPAAIDPTRCRNKPRMDATSAADECRMAVCGAVQGVLDKVGIWGRRAGACL